MPNLLGPDDADGIALGGEVPVAIADGASSVGNSTGLIGGLGSGKSG